MNNKWLAFLIVFASNLAMYTLTSTRDALAEYVFISLCVAALFTVTMKPFGRLIENVVKRLLEKKIKN